MKRSKDPRQISFFQSGGSISGDAAGHQPEESGSIPTPPLQPKELYLEPIKREEAARIWVQHHYIHRDVPGMSLELGVFSPLRELVGAIGFSEWVPWAPEGGRPQIWELRRLWLDDRCQKNSESRVVRVALRYVKKLCPHLTKVISYSDLGVGHKGTIYRAAGFIFDGETTVNDGNAYGNTKEISQTIKRRYVALL